MTFSGINWISIVISVFVTFIASGIWFGPKTFYPVWQREIGTSNNEHEVKNAGVLFGSMFLGVILQVSILGWVINSLQAHDASFGILDGGLIGLWLGVGICAVPNLGHRLFAKHGVKVWLIENSIDVVSLAISGAIIAGMR